MNYGGFQYFLFYLKKWVNSNLINSTGKVLCYQIVNLGSKIAKL